MVPEASGTSPRAWGRGRGVVLSCFYRAVIVLVLRVYRVFLSCFEPVRFLAVSFVHTCSHRVIAVLPPRFRFAVVSSVLVAAPRSHSLVRTCVGHAASGCGRVIAEVSDLGRGSAGVRQSSRLDYAALRIAAQGARSFCQGGAVQDGCLMTTGQRRKSHRSRHDDDADEMSTMVGR